MKLNWNFLRGEGGGGGCKPKTLRDYGGKTGCCGFHIGLSE